MPLSRDALSRRTLLRGGLATAGGWLSLPRLDARAESVTGDAIAEGATNPPPMRLLVVGNPFGAHPEHFFPKSLGPLATGQPPSRTLSSLDWLADRLTVVSHTDHGMKSGHGREIAFLSGVLPEQAAGFAEKNVSFDQLVARQSASRVRFPSIHATLQEGIRMSWNANGVDIKPIADPHALHDHLFGNLTKAQKRRRRVLIDRNASLLDAVSGQYERLRRSVGRDDRDRLGQYAESVRSLERTLADRRGWVGRDKPSFDLAPYFGGDAEADEETIANRYRAVFDMVAMAFQTDLTRVATVAFPRELAYTTLDGVNRSYHGCTHNGRKEDLVDELVAIESFQIAQLSHCLKRLDAVAEPGGDGSLLDHTVVLFGSGMGYGGTHSNRNLPILVAGGGFRHLGHVDARDLAARGAPGPVDLRGGSESGDGSVKPNLPLCNLYLTLLRRLGVERDRFAVSTGAFDLEWS